MANMSYCRFENTVDDMEDCINALDDYDWYLNEIIINASSDQEASAIERFVELCKTVANAFKDRETLSDIVKEIESNGFELSEPKTLDQIRNTQ